MNMSFSMTTRQIRDQSKSVTRRNGWARAKAGQIVTAIERGQGLKKGEKVVKLCPLLFTSVRRERLDRMITEPEYGRAEVILEGFPELTPEEFVAMYCRANHCEPSHVVTRIEFAYGEAPPL